MNVDLILYAIKNGIQIFSLTPYSKCFNISKDFLDSLDLPKITNVCDMCYSHFKDVNYISPTFDTLVKSAVKK
jgi:hypothetical protein